MDLTKETLTALQKKLKIGNRRDVHLNAIPANSNYKLDLSKLSQFNKDLPGDFIKSLLLKSFLKFKISCKGNVSDSNSQLEKDQAEKDQAEFVKKIKTKKTFENLINQTESIESEKGINTFGFGFPVLIRRDQLDRKLTVAPVLIWRLRIKRAKESDTWEIVRNEEDSIYLNEVLINHLKNDSGIRIDQVSNETLDNGLITKDNLLQICVDLIKSIKHTCSCDDLKEIFREKVDRVVPIEDKRHYEKCLKNSNDAFIEFGGLFSIFEVQKQNIINDYENLMKSEDLIIDLKNLEDHRFQSISSIETDPSQQGILHSLEATRNILIQGPPGTGKSQTLTSILLNALESHKKTIVVCEKRTALEVLYKALTDKRLNEHVVLIRDVVKDRKNVVSSVRDRVNSFGGQRHKNSSPKDILDTLIEKSKKLINSINDKHKKLDEELLCNKFWTDVVGNFITESKGIKDDQFLNSDELDKLEFKYSSQELSELLEIIKKGEKLYSEYQKIEPQTFINPKKLINATVHSIKKEINKDFKSYSELLEEVKALYEKTKNEYFELRKNELSNQIKLTNNLIVKEIFAKKDDLCRLIEESHGKYCKCRDKELSQKFDEIHSITSSIELIFKKNKNNQYITNTKKINSFGYKLLSRFSQTKRQIIQDHSKLLEKKNRT